MTYIIGKIIFTFWFNVFNRLRIYGKENISSDRPLIVFANHASACDVFLLNIAFKKMRIRFMAKKEIFDIPVAKQCALSYGAFPVDRDNNDISAVKTTLRLLKQGEVLGIFPEGTRVRNNGEVPVKGGYVMFAHRTGATMQPVRICYKRRLMIFNSVKVYIGKPIKASELNIDKNAEDKYSAIGEKLISDIYGMNDANY